MKQLPLVASFVLFIGLCMSLAFWGMQLFKPAARPVAPPPQTQRQEVHVEAATALFGGRPAAVAVASNYQLRGVVMAGRSNESIAILSADGKPATATPVDKEVQPGVTVKEVHPTYVVLLENGVSKRVELPESAKGQLNGLTAPPMGGQMPNAETGGTPIPGPAPSPSGTQPMPGFAGAPPVVQPAPEAQAPTANPNGGPINIPAPR